MPKKAPPRKKVHHQNPRGVNYAKSLVIDKKIEKLEKQAAHYKSKMEGKQIVTYEGVDHVFTSWWTNAPRAASRDRPKKPRDA